tara:strand:+ start:934 stop:1446 length:513 start_codon:yes stop_codon:yes gene_type:complete
MAINIPSSVFNTYNEAVLLFTRTATLVYPEKKEDCPNCIMNTMGTRNKSVSVYQAGGPYPFTRGMPCPYCNGKGYKAVEATDDITLRIYWDRKSWVKIGASIDIPDGSIQTIAYMTDLPKIEQCKHMIPNYDGIEKYDKAKYERNGPSFPQGFKQNETKYVVTFWNRADG